MKRIVFVLMMLLALSGLTAASASGNATIAVRGRDGFEDYIGSLIAWDGRLLLASYNAMYEWSPDGGLRELSGYEELEKQLAPQESEDGTRVVRVGGQELELGEGESLYFYGGNLYPAGGKLYRMADLSGDDGTQSVLLVEVTVEEDGSFALAGFLDLGDALVEQYGEYYGVKDLNQSCFVDGMLYGLSWGESSLELVKVDLENCDADSFTLDIEGELSGIAAFDEGRLLLTAYQFDQELTASLYLYDTGSGEATLLGALPVGSEMPMGLCYDAARSRIYYVQDGCVWRADVSETGVGEPEAFSDMPLEIYSDASPVLLGDLYVLASYEGVVGRDVTAERMPEQRLTIAEMAYLEPIRSAYFDFTNLHPEYAVTIGNSELDTDELIQAMMTQSSDTDIFVMYANNPVFGALLTRGYMAELDGSEALSAYAQSLYPVLSQLCTKDGALCAVPLDLSVSAQSINRTLLTEKLGLTEEDIPASWPELFGLLGELAKGRMQDAPEAYLLYEGSSLANTKGTFLSWMMETFLLWLDADEANLERADDVLLAMLHAYEQIDWAGFGMPEEAEEEGLFSSDENMLFTQIPFTPASADVRRDGETVFEPLMLSVVEGEARMLGGSVRVAFVNPFSEQREAAIEYLEAAVERIEPSELIALCPEQNDPIENAQYEEIVTSYDEMIAQTQESIAKAEEREDDETLAALEESLANLKEGREWYEQNGQWEVSPEGIARYREAASCIVPERSALWREEEAVTQLTQYVDGAITAEQFVAEFGKAMQMRRLEDM